MLKGEIGTIVQCVGLDSMQISAMHASWVSVRGNGFGWQCHVAVYEFLEFTLAERPCRYRHRWQTRRRVRFIKLESC